MFFNISQNELFELLQSENFIIGKSLFNKTLSLVENVTHRPLKEKNITKKLLANFKTLKNKWQKLKGGRNREIFRKNLTQNIILKIEENEFESITVETNFSESTNVFTNNQDTPQFTDDSIRNVRNWVHSTRHKRRKIRGEIQKHLSQSNKFLNKFGLCFKNVEICDSKLQKYNNTFKITSSKLISSFK
jgi:hypothetical protein